MIKYLIIDVDGTLTDGMIYMGDNGEMFKAFNIKDGAGIKDILPKYGICPIIITARSSTILKRRCDELGVNFLYQGVRDKIGKLNELLNEQSNKSDNDYSLSNCAYIGDDILDLQCMIPIHNAGGIVGCPADAVKQVKDVSDFVSLKDGGKGAVRDFIEYITSEQSNGQND